MRGLFIKRDTTAGETAPPSPDNIVVRLPLRLSPGLRGGDTVRVWFHTPTRALPEVALPLRERTTSLSKQDAPPHVVRQHRDVVHRSGF
jgi:hypothetical protein